MLVVAALGLSAHWVQAADDGVRGDPLHAWLQARGLIGAGEAPQPVAQPGADAAPNRAAELVLSATSFLGVPYRWGGNDADTGFDCSGFTRFIYQNSIGLLLPRRADEQATSGVLQNVNEVDELRPGDLVFFNTMRRAFSHVGIYIGDHKFIHAPRTGALVRVDDMRLGYWMKRFNGARRAPGADPAQVAAITRPTE